MRIWLNYVVFLGILAITLLNGCTVLAVGAIGAAAGTTAAIATDPRSSGVVVDDNTIEAKLKLKYTSDYPDSNIYTTSYEGVVLLTGQAVNESERSKIEFDAIAIPGVKKIYDYVQIQPTQSFGTSSSDSLITTKVRTQILTLGGVSSNSVKVVTTDGVVYLLGIVNPTQAKQIADSAANIDGVKKVVTLFKYVA